MSQCAVCETENPDDFKFCENCGKRLDMISCPTCSHLNLRDMKFCEECGQRLDIIKCPVCTHENPRNFKFCEECGHSLFEPKKPPYFKTVVVPIVTQALVRFVISSVIGFGVGKFGMFALNVILPYFSNP